MMRAGAPWCRIAHAAAVALLLAACAGKHGAAAVPPQTLTTGSGASDYACAPDPAVADEIARTLANADEDAYQDARAKALAVPPGTRVTVVGRAAGPHPKVQVRVEGGLYRDDVCWYPSNVKGLLR